MNVVPECGGDTMFASSYEAYDRLSPSMKTFLEGLTATHDGKVFREQAARYGFDLYTDERGHPANVGDDLVAVHPVVRTDRASAEFDSILTSRSGHGLEVALRQPHLHDAHQRALVRRERDAAQLCVAGASGNC